MACLVESMLLYRKGIVNDKTWPLAGATPQVLQGRTSELMVKSYEMVYRKQNSTDTNACNRRQSSEASAQAAATVVA